MINKFKVIMALAVFLPALFLGLKAEPTAGLVDEGKIEDVAKKVYPSVVKVEVRNRVRKVATGVVFDKNGYIVTTALVSPRDEEISVITSKGKKIEAKFLGMDLETNLALVQAMDKNLIPITMGESKDLSPGSWIGVVSISPEDTPAITQGIVSSVSQEKLRLNVWVVPGSSGSPVVDGEGRMVGLLRGAYSDDKPVVFEFREKELVGSGFVFSKAEAPSSGLAHAIPVDVVKSVASEIKEKGRVERGWLGVSISDENEERKVEIIAVEKESPAELAKLKKGDFILQIEGKDMTNTKMLVKEIRKRKPGKTVTLKIERDGKISDVKVKLGERPEKEMERELEFKFPRLFPPRPPRPPKIPKAPVPREPEVFRWGFEHRKYIGVYLEEINRELSEYFGIKEGRGLLVSKVGENSPAEKAGLKVGDVIVKADGERVERVRDLSEAIQDKEKGEKIKLEILRNRKERSVEVEIEEEERGGVIRYYSKDWEDYVDFWDDYSEDFEKSYKKYQDQYYQSYEKLMKKFKKEIEGIGKKYKDAVKEYKISSKMRRAIVV